MLLNGLGRFQNALGTFQEAPGALGSEKYGFSKVLRGFLGGEAKGARGRAYPNAAWSGPLNTSKLQLPQATYHFPLRSDHFDRRRPMGKYHLAPTHTVAQSAVVDNKILNFEYHKIVLF